MREDGTHIIEIGSHMLERVNLPTADQGTHRNASGRLLNRGSQLWRFVGDSRNGFGRGFGGRGIRDSQGIASNRRTSSGGGSPPRIAIPSTGFPCIKAHQPALDGILDRIVIRN